MRASPLVYFSVSAFCCCMLGVALYLQLGMNMLPCPLCVLQRYAFVAIAITSLAAALTQFQRSCAGIALLSALTGAGVAIKHLYVLAHPAMSCGIDPLETGLNQVVLAQWWPTMFAANGLCETPYPPILGLSIPTWALLGFSLCAIALLSQLLRPAPRSMFASRI